MPLYWTIDTKQRFFTGVAEGEVTFDDAIALLEALAAVKALSYRKLFDGRAARPTMTGEELLAGCGQIRAYHDQRHVSPHRKASVTGPPTRSHSAGWIFGTPRAPQTWPLRGRMPAQRKRVVPKPRCAIEGSLTSSRRLVRQ